MAKPKIGDTLQVTPQNTFFNAVGNQKVAFATAPTTIQEGPNAGVQMSPSGFGTPVGDTQKNLTAYKANPLMAPKAWIDANTPKEPANVISSTKARADVVKKVAEVSQMNQPAQQPLATTTTQKPDGTVTTKEKPIQGNLQPTQTQTPQTGETPATGQNFASRGALSEQTETQTTSTDPYTQLIESQLGSVVERLGSTTPTAAEAEIINTYQRQKKAMEERQRAEMELQKLAGIRSGRYQFAPDSQAQGLAELAASHEEQINFLESQKNLDVMRAQEAARKENWQEFYGLYDKLQASIKQKQDLRQQQLDTMIKLEQLEQSKAKEAREGLKFNLEMQDRLNQPFTYLSPEINKTLLTYLQEHPDAQVSPNMTALEAIQAVQASESWQAKQAKENRQPGDLGDFLYLKDAPPEVQQGYLEFSKYMANLKAKSAGSGSSELANAIRMQTLQNAQLESMKKMEELNLGYDEQGNLIQLPGLSAKELAQFEKNSEVKAIKGLRDLSIAVDEYERVFNETGQELFGFTGNAKKLASSRDRVIAQIGKLDDLGVLQPSDIARLENTVAKPFGVRAALPNSQITGQLDQLKTNVQQLAQSRQESLQRQQPKFVSELEPEFNAIFGKQTQTNQAQKYGIKF